MKHLLLLTLLLSLPIFAQSQEEAIKKVCMAETQAWLDADFNAWVATHAQHENETVAWTNPDGSFVNEAFYPTDPAYPYVNLYRGYLSIDPLEQILWDNNRQGDEWWAAAG